MITVQRTIMNAFVSIAALLFLLSLSQAYAQVAGNEDRPLVSGGDFRKLDSLTAPLVDSARKSWPAVRKRFLKGLPTDQILFVMTRLTDAEGKFEQIFLQVGGIAGDTIEGTIASDVMAIRGIRHGDPHSIREADLLDWSIVHPDGSEEGNVVGKFLDWLQNPEENDR